MEDRVYRFNHTAENLPRIARGIDPSEENHYILTDFTGSRTIGALTDKRGTTRRGHAAEGSGLLSLFQWRLPAPILAWLGRVSSGRVRRTHPIPRGHSKHSTGPTMTIRSV
jgi:hypothetical protein